MLVSYIILLRFYSKKRNTKVEKIHERLDVTMTKLPSMLKLPM